VPITCCVRNFKDLKVWERSHRLVLESITLLRGFLAKKRLG
jgi:hypothetical protein